MLTLPIGPLAGLAQVQESGCAGGEAWTGVGESRTCPECFQGGILGRDEAPELAKRVCVIAAPPYLPQSSSASRFTAGALGSRDE